MKVLRYKNKEGLLSELQNISKEKDVNKFVIGYPISMNYKENEMTKIIDSFKQDMENLDFEVILDNEFFDMRLKLPHILHFTLKI